MFPRAAQFLAILTLLSLCGPVLPWRKRGPAAAPAFSFAWVLAACAAAAVALTAASLASFDLPHGDWDAWSIWNVKARFLAHADWWRHAVTPGARSHPDYPLLLPALVSVVGRPDLVALFFAAAGATALAVSVWRLRGTALAALAVLTLAVSTNYLTQVPSQYADVPLSVLMLVALAALVSEDWHAAGFAAGAAAFTKNEGLVFALAFLAAAAIVRRDRFHWIAAGALPGLVVTIWFKLAYAPASEYAGQSLGKLFEGARWSAILSRIPDQLWNLGMGVGHPLLMMAVLAAGLRFALPLSREWKAAAAVIGVQLTGYLAAYLITPNDLAWQLDTSMHRLAAQVWPSMLLLFFMALRAPDSIAGAAAESSGNTKPERRKKKAHA